MNKTQIGVGAAVVVVVAIVAALLLRDDGDSDTAADPDPAIGTSSSASPDSTATPESAAPAPQEKPPAGTSTKPTSTSPIPPERKPVPIDEEVRGDDSVEIAIVQSEVVKGKAKVAGEISGPAVRLTLQIRNDSKKPLDLDYVTVNAYTGKGRLPAPPIMAPGGRPVSGTLKPGAQTEGVYLFSAAKKDRALVTVGVDYRIGEPTVVFRGPFVS